MKRNTTRMRDLKYRVLLAAAALMTLFTTHPALAGKPAPPPPPPPPANPAFVYSGGTDLRVMNMDGSNDTLVLANASLFSNVRCCWSPDRSEIAFSARPLNPDGTTRLDGVYAVRTDGNGMRMVTQAWAVADVAWSPVPIEVGGVSSHWILFNDIGPDTGTGYGEGIVCAVRSTAGLADQSSRTVLSDPSDGWDEEWGIAWAPDGTRFATLAASRGHYEYRVYLLSDVDGQLAVSGVTAYPWPSSVVGSDVGVSWARTQDQLVVSLSLAGETNSRIAIVDLTDGSYRFLNGIPQQQYGNLRYPVWSPDDSQISFVLRARSSKDAKMSGLYRLTTANPSNTVKVSAQPTWLYDWSR